MKILNFGSLNIDYVYQLPHFVQPGETISAENYNIYAGGKGLNQSIAVARAGNEIYHAGKLGKGGEGLKECLLDNNINTTYLGNSDQNQGHAIIQVNDSGENCIIVFSGSNSDIDKGYVDMVLDQFDENTYLILQNEINNLSYIIEKACSKNMIIILNPSPVDDSIQKLDLSKITWLFINAVEGQALSGASDYNEIIPNLCSKFPGINVLLTLGEKGALCCCNGEITTQEIFKVSVADTTAAGDTFTGYFISGLVNGRPTKEILKTASAASAISVSRNGASTSIPTAKEVEKYLKEQLQ